MYLPKLKYFLLPSFISKRFCSSTNSLNKVSLCVIGNGAEGNPRSVFLNYHDRVFMFNCSEGLQRLITDLGFKSSKIESFFTTSNRWSNVSGLSSLLLARYDARCKEFFLFNKFNENLLKHSIVFDTKLKKIKYHFLDSDDFTYEKLSIKAIPIDFEIFKTIVYLGKLSAEKGKINLEKCFHSKVPRNLVPELEQGKSILNSDGKTIQPIDVSDPDYSEQHFMIFESFDPEIYFDKVLSNEEIKNFLPKCEAVVHFTCDKHLSSPSYQKFIRQNNSSHHLLVTESNPPFSLYSKYRFHFQLNLMDSELFPPLQEIDEFKTPKFIEELENVIRSPTGIEYVFRSSISSTLSDSKVPQLPTLTDSLLYKDGSEREGIEESLKKLNVQQKSLSKPIISNAYPEFIFLGTASSLSLPIRNVSVILVNLDKQNSILIECGENSYGQLLDFYGQQKIGQVLANIKAIFISHHHSDHHMGLIQMLKKYQRHCKSSKKIWILLPPMVHKFLSSNIFELPKQNQHLIPNHRFDKVKSAILRDLNIKDMDLIPVDHCAYAYGISITDKTNFKFVYSGDTQPCERLIDHGRNCNLLIHEATVEDSLVRFARINFHSTRSEAIKVGETMKADFTMLTHFSQRYGKLPFTPDEKNCSNVGIAFDNMRINRNLMKRIPLLYEPLKCMYSKHLDKLRYRSDLYERKFQP